MPAPWRWHRRLRCAFAVCCHRVPALSLLRCARVRPRAVVPNRFGIHPLVEGPGRHVHPKTTTFCLVLGFTPSRQPSRAHQSQNDLEQLYSGSTVALPDPVSQLPFPVLSFPVLRTCNVRKKIGLTRTFGSGRVTSGNCQPAFQGPLWPIPVFPTYNVRMKIGIPRRFCS